MISIEHSVTINRPIEEVFTFVTNIENGTQWQSGVLESRQTSQGPAGVGATGMEVRQFMGLRVESSFEVTEYEPSRKMGFKTTSGPIPLEGNYTFEPTEGGTKVTFAVQLEPSGVFKLAEALVARTARKQVETDCSNLKYLLEAQT